MNDLQIQVILDRFKSIDESLKQIVSLLQAANIKAGAPYDVDKPREQHK